MTPEDRAAIWNLITSKLDIRDRDIVGLPSTSTATLTVPISGNSPLPPTRKSMPMKPSDTPAEFIPDYEETKLAKTAYSKLLAAYAAKTAAIAELESEAKAFKNEMASLLMKHKLTAVRCEGYTTRWVEPGPGKPTLVPELVMQMLGPAKFSKCQKPGTQRAAYFAVFSPKARKEEE